MLASKREGVQQRREWGWALGSAWAQRCATYHPLRRLRDMRETCGPGVYTLLSETGRRWDNVALVKYPRLKLYRAAAPPMHAGGPPGNGFLRTARVTWRWVQQSIRV